jgi:hypothetical protein
VGFIQLKDQTSAWQKTEDLTQKWMIPLGNGKFHRKMKFPFDFLEGDSILYPTSVYTLCPLEVLYVSETTGLYFSFCSNGKKMILWLCFPHSMQGNTL